MALVVAGVLGVVSVAGRDPSPEVPLVVAGGRPQLPASAPPAAVLPGPAGSSGAGAAGLAGWAAEVTSRVDLPARAAEAYAAAHLAVADVGPRCGVTWATLAGIGRIESDHGRYDGRALQADGRPDSPIIGIPLDGSPEVRAIADTDGGTLDGDGQWDRAVGPMQFIPSTWARWADDGDGDGRSDPQDIDDAALAAARYLCAGGGDLGTGEGWWAAVLSYNASVPYGRAVFAAAQTYAAAAP